MNSSSMHCPSILLLLLTASSLLSIVTCGSNNLGFVTAASQPSSFIVRENSSLFDPSSPDPSKPFKYLGANIYWLGLDQNVPPGHVAYPTKFRIRDALLTAKGLGLKVVRSHTLGISTGNPLSFEPSNNVFNAKALDAADYAIYFAGELGLRLIIPLTDNYRYYHGGFYDFCKFLGVSITSVSHCENEFYNNETVVAAFQNYIKHRLTHVNPYTGRPAILETAILAWETGNELRPPPLWSKNIATFIKSIDKNHLVLSGTDYVSLEELTFPVIDIHSSHYYPPNDATLEIDVEVTKAAGKVYVAGEFGWTYNQSSMTLSSFLDIIEKSPSAFSALFWSLFPHDDGKTHDYGYVNHNDGFTMHYFPGDFPFMSERLETIQNYAWKIGTGNSSNKCADSSTWFNVSSAPILQQYHGTASSLSSSSSSVCLVWQGATGATEYNIYKNCSSSWILFHSGLTDFELPFCFVRNSDSASSSDSVCQYQVEPVARVCGVAPGPKSNIISI